MYGSAVGPDADPDRQKILWELFAHSPFPMVVFRGFDGPCTMCNPSFRSLVEGVEPIGKDLRSIWPSLAESLEPYALELRFGARGVLDRDITVLPPTGSGAVMHLACDIMRSESGSGFQEPYFIHVFRVLTEQVEERIKLKLYAESEKVKLRYVASEMKDGLAILEPNGDISYANPPALAFLPIGIPMEGDGTLRLKSLARQFLFEDERGNPVVPGCSPIRKVLSGIYTMGEYRLTRKSDGVSWDLQITGTPVWGLEGEGHGGILLVRDVTERRKHELELKALLDSKDLFLGMASHELKTPLTVMMANLQLMRVKDDEIGVDKRNGMIDSLLAQGRKLDRLVNDLLDVTRLISGHLAMNMRDIDLGLLVSGVVEEKSKLYQTHGIRITQWESVAFRGDSDRLEQVLSNLISNAVRYSPAGSEIEVGICRVEATLSIWVRDHGSGMEPGKIDRIFELYYRGTPKWETGSGLGLGLYISKEIVGLHGGEIRAVSTPGQGSTFTITFPLTLDTNGSSGYNNVIQ